MAVRLISTQPAQLFRLFPERGVLRPGAIADVVIYDPQPKSLVDSSRWFTKARVIDRLYHGRKQQGVVRTTLVNGQIVFNAGQIVAKPGAGRFIRPQDDSSGWG